MGLQGWQWILIVVVILLLFGATKLPALAKSVGQSARVFKGEMKAMKEEDTTEADGATPASGTAPHAAAPAPELRSDAGGTSEPRT